MAVMFGVGRVEMRRGGTKCGTRCGGVSGDFYRPGRQVEVMGGHVEDRLTVVEFNSAVSKLK
jgi:hypothetical protein